MNKPAKIIGAILIICICVLIGSCEKKQVPVLETSEISNITGTTATSGGKITDEGSGTVISRGICWSTGDSPTIAENKTTDGAGAGTFTSNISELNGATKYFVRAYATNNAGTGYGMAMSFTTGVSDIEGNLYSVKKIGTQVWIKENLRVTKYNDNLNIENVTSNSNWLSLNTGAYCWYQNNESIYKSTYGALYNWYAVSSGRLCPTGWHVPSDAEITTLVTFLGGESTAGGKLKEIGTAHWQSPNVGATNETGFTALPGGNRNFDGTFEHINYYGYWWSSTEHSLLNHSYYWDMCYNYSNVDRNNHDKGNGFSIRCIKDN